MNTLLTTNDVAKVLRLAPWTVRKYLREHKLRGMQLGDDWRVRREDLDTFVRRRLTQGRKGGRS